MPQGESQTVELPAHTRPKTWHTEILFLPWIYISALSSPDSMRNLGQTLFGQESIVGISTQVIQSLCLSFLTCSSIFIYWLDVIPWFFWFGFFNENLNVIFIVRLGWRLFSCPRFPFDTIHTFKLEINTGPWAFMSSARSLKKTCRFSIF